MNLFNAGYSPLHHEDYEKIELVESFMRKKCIMHFRQMGSKNAESVKCLIKGFVADTGGILFQVLDENDEPKGSNHSIMLQSLAGIQSLEKKEQKFFQCLVYLINGNRDYFECDCTRYGNTHMMELIIEDRIAYEVPIRNIAYIEVREMPKEKVESQDAVPSLQK